MANEPPFRYQRFNSFNDLMNHAVRPLYANLPSFPTPRRIQKENPPEDHLGDWIREYFENQEKVRRDLEESLNRPPHMLVYDPITHIWK